MLKLWKQNFSAGVQACGKMNTVFYPFTLNFDGSCARFSFIFEGRPVEVINGGVGGNNSVPSCLISNRAAGDMAFQGVHSPIREDFFRSQKIPPEKVYSLIQIHSHDVFTLGNPEEVTAPLPAPAVFARQGDGMVSFSPNAVLAVTVADCLPVFLLDTEKGYWAVLHSGWKGTGIVLNALKIMQDAGTAAAAVAAVLGPCIQSCCYSVNEERAMSFEAQFGAPLAHAAASGSGYPLGPVSRQDKSLWYINLQAANARLLAAAGVQHISYCTDCTFSDTRLGSFRREGGQSFTRMIAMTGAGLL
jgi:YfiH family protein